ncbi:hypothetical protein RRG08_019707 [Elysia crispata]|uniref:Uncharacterized protein n=1 Tax=Elysia crispata TaxID=231223 RepID=A0AAE1EAL9_9GAST|nr:hypothetical protein RRG08_019707 [Elysia crispata]
MLNIFYAIGYFIFQIFHLLFHAVAFICLSFTEVLALTGELINYMTHKTFDMLHWILYVLEEKTSRLDLTLHSNKKERWQSMN